MNLKVLLWIVAGALVSVLVAIIVLFNVVAAGQRQDAYERCLTAHGYSPGPQSQEQLDVLIDAADACSG